MSLLIVIGVFFTITRYRFSYKSALKASVLKQTDKIEIIQLHRYSDNDYMLFHNATDNTYGQAEFFKLFGILYRTGFVSFGNKIPDKSPFIVLEMYEPDTFVLFIQSNNPNIKYVSSGTEKTSFSDTETIDTSIEYVKKKPEFYELKELKNGYAVFNANLTGNNDKDGLIMSRKRTILGFDSDGKLIADRIALLYGRYINTK